MATKREIARLIAEELISKENDLNEAEKILKVIQDRTDPDGNLTISIETTKLLIPASTIEDIFSLKKENIEIQLDRIADKFNGK